MAEPVVLAALALDAALGWPRALYRCIGHPVGLFARWIDACEQGWNRPERSEIVRRLLGVLTVALLITLVTGGTWALETLLRQGLGGCAWLAVAVLAWPALAQRSLYDHVRPVAACLQAGDIDAARKAVSLIVGRDTASLDEAGI